MDVDVVASTSDPLNHSRRLPNELLLLVKEHIPVSDLRTHVCYYHTCRTVTAFYGDESQQADFWRRSCLLAGLNFVGTDSSYKDIAFECIIKDGFCAHPACGGSLLDWNAREIEIAMERYSWDPEDGPCDAHYSEEELSLEEQEAFPSLSTNRIFSHIAFNKERHHNFPTGYTFLRCNNPDGFRLPPHKRMLRDHPIASRSLAAFPSTTRMTVRYPNSEQFVAEMLHNPNGIRVMDVVHHLQINLDNDITVRELNGFLNDGCFEGLLPPESQTITMQMLSQLQTLRSLWAFARWEVLDWDGVDVDGPQCAMRFSPLPEDLFEKEVQEELSIHG